MRAALPDGRELRHAPLHERHQHPRASERDVWRGNGTLKIAPTGRPWSVWLFWDDHWHHLCWYVNLEDVHVRDDAGIVTRDHELDVVIRADGSTKIKDEDELDAAVAAGRFTAADAASFHHHARDILGIARARGAPFDDDWPLWRPDPGWPLPQLPVSAWQNRQSANQDARTVRGAHRR
ncbi:DUF402 domain-containing protein [Phytoactinopolyspora limicola]|uniref:DUF402 domain-containing protein n=1 Tax=Phytoactinopolyspora limicola TaxID=2715536 RepID=UPI001409C3A8|nr:DUF402 domain-containing protein [Phytoactinopolyspora limicola]